MELESFAFTPANITSGIEVIREMKSITQIGISGGSLMPPDEFWKKYDAGEFGKQ